MPSAHTIEKHGSTTAPPRAAPSEAQDSQEELPVRARRVPGAGWREALLTVFAGLLALGAGSAIMRVWDYGIRVPFAYGGDALASLMFAKGIVDNGWVQVNPYLGAPGRLEMYDYPLGGDNVNFLIMKVFAGFTDSPAVVLNLFYLTTFLLIGMTTYAVLRRLTVSIPFAMLGAAMFAITPYHFSRGVGHALLSAYYMVPVGVYLAVRLYQGRRVPRRSAGRASWLSWQGAVLALACIVLGGTGVYYAAFSCLLIFGLGTLGVIRHRSWGVLVAMLITLALIGGSSIANQASTISYRKDHGDNPLVGHRVPQESEIYALNITQLLLPLPGNHIAALDHARTRYVTTSAEATGESMSPLGTVPSIGLIASLLVVLALVAFPVTGRRRRWVDVAAPLSIAVVALLLIATKGGFSALFNYGVDPSIRAWGRASVVIAFLSIAVLMLLVSTALGRRPGRWRALPWAVAVLLGAVVAYDQATPIYILPKAQWESSWEADEAMGRKVEAALPKRAMVYQLPYVAWPESVPVPGQDGSYDNARAYLHTRDVRWSFASMSGRPQDIGPKLADLEPAELVPRLRDLGFRAVWFDRSAYASRPEFEKQLTDQLGTPIVEGASDRFAVFSLA